MNLTCTIPLQFAWLSVRTEKSCNLRRVTIKKQWERNASLDLDVSPASDRTPVQFIWRNHVHTLDLLRQGESLMTLKGSILLSMGFSRLCSREHTMALQFCSSPLESCTYRPEFNPRLSSGMTKYIPSQLPSPCQAQLTWTAPSRQGDSAKFGSLNLGEPSNTNSTGPGLSSSSIHSWHPLITRPVCQASSQPSHHFRRFEATNITNQSTNPKISMSKGFGGNTGNMEETSPPCQCLACCGQDLSAPKGRATKQHEHELVCAIWPGVQALLRHCPQRQYRPSQGPSLNGKDSEQALYSCKYSPGTQSDNKSCEMFTGMKNTVTGTLLTLPSSRSRRWQRESQGTLIWTAKSSVLTNLCSQSQSSRSTSGLIFQIKSWIGSSTC